MGNRIRKRPSDGVDKRSDIAGAGEPGFGLLEVGHRAPLPHGGPGVLSRSETRKAPFPSGSSVAP
jgi:hypothetical protein